MVWLIVICIDDILWDAITITTTSSGPFNALDKTVYFARIWDEELTALKPDIHNTSLAETVARRSSFNLRGLIHKSPLGYSLAIFRLG